MVEWLKRHKCDQYGLGSKAICAILLCAIEKHFSTKEGPKKCPIYLKLPWIGENSLKFERKIKLSTNNCFGAVQPRMIFSTRRILPAIHKDVLPTFQQSNVVYEYVCHCDSWYVGRTSQRLQDRIRQHVPKSIWNRTSQERKQPERPGKLANSIPHCDSAIGNHLLHNQKCASHYKDNQFFILFLLRLLLRTINFLFSF